jgi:hypothetical protein
MKILDFDYYYIKCYSKNKFYAYFQGWHCIDLVDKGAIPGRHILNIIKWLKEDASSYFNKIDQLEIYDFKNNKKISTLILNPFLKNLGVRSFITKI